MALELARTQGVSKRFGALMAVREVSCAFRAGEIHAVCGENGAGKSTLLKLVAGMLPPDGGSVSIGDSVLAPHTPREAIRRGVAMVLQHFALVPVFTALENIILGAEHVGPLGVLDRASAVARAKQIASELGATLPLDERVESLGVGDRQRIEIARALFRDARLVILDEPTAVLTKTEAASLYATVRRLATTQNKGIVVVTHKMDEVRLHADVVSVMRRGELVFTRPLDRTGDVSAQVDEVTAAIMGAVARRHAAPIERSAAVADAAKVASPTAVSSRSANEVVDAVTDVALGGDGGKDATPPGKDAVSAGDTGKDDASAGDNVLVMNDVCVGRALVDASLTLRAGEIVGVAGVEGNGQRELVALLAGDLVPDAGTLTAKRTTVIREDRQTEGLVLDATLRDNLVLGELARFTRWGVIDVAALEGEASARLERSGAPPALDLIARTLSGGNQQKLVVVRALARDADVIVAAQPTRGVDLAASMDIHAELQAAAKRGAGILVISADLDELRRLSSRILVIARGRFVADLPPTATDDELGRLMLGLGTTGAPS